MFFPQTIHNLSKFIYILFSLRFLNNQTLKIKIIFVQFFLSLLFFRTQQNLTNCQFLLLNIFSYFLIRNQPGPTKLTLHHHPPFWNLEFSSKGISQKIKKGKQLKKITLIYLQCNNFQKKKLHKNNITSFSHVFPLINM